MCPVSMNWYFLCKFSIGNSCIQFVLRKLRWWNVFRILSNVYARTLFLKKQDYKTSLPFQLTEEFQFELSVLFLITSGKVFLTGRFYKIYQNEVKTDNLTLWILRFLPTYCNWGVVCWTPTAFYLSISRTIENRANCFCIINNIQCVAKIRNRIDRLASFIASMTQNFFFHFSEKCSTAALWRVVL